MFHLTADEEESPSKLIKFAESLPQVGKSGDQSQDDDYKYVRKQLMKHINTLWRNPKLIPRALDWLEDRVLEEMSAGQADVFKSLSTLGKVDETWAAAWIVGNSSLTLKTLEKVCDVDSDGVRQLYIFALVAQLSLKLHQSMRVKAVMNLSFISRAQMCGNRLSRLNDTNVIDPQSGAIHWAVVGVYQPIWDGEDTRLWRIRHKPTGHIGVIPDHVIVDKSVELLLNWDDSEVSLVKKPSRLPCRDLFEGKRGPWGVPPWQGAKDNNLTALVEVAEAEHELKMEELNNNDLVVTPQKFRQVSKDEHKKQGMIVAREAL